MFSLFILTSSEKRDLKVCKVFFFFCPTSLFWLIGECVPELHTTAVKILLVLIYVFHLLYKSCANKSKKKKIMGRCSCSCCPLHFYFWNRLCWLQSWHVIEIFRQFIANIPGQVKAAWTLHTFSYIAWSLWRCMKMFVAVWHGWALQACWFCWVAANEGVSAGNCYLASIGFHSRLR